MSSFQLAIFASGSGSNAEEIIRYFQGHPHIAVKLVVSNNPEAFVVTRARRLGIDAETFSKAAFADGQDVRKTLRDHNITHIALAGFLLLVPGYLIRDYPERIVNIHPALLPKFGGKGMYGLRVHEAVKAAGEKESGITIHLVNERYDEGKILFQERCSLANELNPKEIAQCVQKLEHHHYPRVIEQWILQSAQPGSSA